MNTQTRRQREVLDFITKFIESHGYRPSYQVIARHLGVSSRAGIARIVHDLESQGLLQRRRENGHFYIDVGRQNTESKQENSMIEWLDVPRSGYKEPWENQPFAVPQFMLGVQSSDRLRAFRVPDSEMAGENISEDDIALIELRQFVRDGEKTVVVLDGEKAVLRKYFRAGADVELRRADDEEPGSVTRLPADRVEIKGVFRALLRPSA